MNVDCLKKQSVDEASKPKIMQQCRKLLCGVLSLPKSSSNSRLDSKAIVNSVSTAKHPADTKTCVQFKFVEIREHRRILTDHPKCKDGVALGLDWKHSLRTTRISLDSYEKMRKSQGRRSIKSMKRLSFLEKQNLLVKVGGYQEEMVLNAHFKYCHTLDSELKAPAA